MPVSRLHHPRPPGPVWWLAGVAIVALAFPGCGDPELRSTKAPLDGVLSGKRIAILIDDGFEQSELHEPWRALRDAGARPVLVAPHAGMVRGWSGSDWGERVRVDVPLGDARPRDFDALVLPGGVISPDRLRMDPDAVAFVRAFVDERKPIAAICHGPWTLIEAGGVKGRTLTSWPSLRTDLINAGAEWIDVAVFRDGNLVTSRKPSDLPAFNSTMIQVFAGMIAGYVQR